ncbi:MAG: rhodanese-like domain-containing protein [Bacteroidota bacterium]
MKNLFLITFVFLMIASCGQQQGNGETVAKTLPVNEWEEKMKTQPGTVLDVRTTEECAEGMIADAVNMDVNGPDFEKKIEALDKNKPVYVYCRKGRRGESAMEIMKEKGFTNVYNLDGGIVAWIEAGKPVK